MSVSTSDRVTSGCICCIARAHCITATSVVERDPSPYQLTRVSLMRNGTTSPQRHAHLPDILSISLFFTVDSAEYSIAASGS